VPVTSNSSSAPSTRARCMGLLLIAHFLSERTTRMSRTIELRSRCDTSREDNLPDAS
jgi:hypothetical protein